MRTIILILAIASVCYADEYDSENTYRAYPREYQREYTREYEREYRPTYEYNTRRETEERREYRTPEYVSKPSWQR